MKIVRYLIALLALGAAMTSIPSVAATGAGTPYDKAERLSAFGERPAFSPDGSRVAFIGKSYGDAYEIDLATGDVRNLTGAIPHQGFLRVHYLPSGDYLLLGPKRDIGPLKRIRVDLYVLDRHLRRGLQPLDQSVFEGVAIGPHNKIAWQQIPDGSVLRKDETWLQAVERNTLETYVGQIEYRDGKPRLTGKRRIMNRRPGNPAPDGCRGEVQDFRRNGNELVHTCWGSDAAGRYVGIFGHDLATGAVTTFYKARGGEYAEVEGISPDGSWTTVECGQRKGTEFLLDLCRLELTPNGKLSPLIIGSAPGSTRHMGNPVISPNGKMIAFQSGDSAIGDIGEGDGIYLMRIAE